MSLKRPGRQGHKGVLVGFPTPRLLGTLTKTLLLGWVTVWLR